MNLGTESRAVSTGAHEGSDQRVADRRWFRGLLAFCIFATLATLWIGKDRDHIRNPDEAAYAEQARAMLDRGTLEVGFVRHYHVQYPADVLHTEDFYPPGNGALIAASWSVFGRSDFTSTIPSTLLACLVIPLLAFALARRLEASSPFAFGCAVAVLFEPEFRFHAHQALADLPLCASVLGALVLAFGPGHRHAALAGAILGVGFWFKPTALLFLPGLAVVGALADRRSLPQTVVRLAAMGAAMAVVTAPWLARNLAEFGDPLYSGNKHLTATANDPKFRYLDIRKVYWAIPDYVLPALEGSVGRFGLMPVVKRFVEHIYELVVVHGRDAFGILFGIAALTSFHRRRVAGALLFVAAYCVALSAVFAIYFRYMMPTFPIVTAITWAFGDRVLRRLLRSPGEPVILPAVATPARFALLVAALSIIPPASTFVRDVVTGKSDFIPRAEKPMHAAAAWARAHLPEDARVMTTEALMFRHDSDLITVNIPWDVPERMEAVVEHHQIDYLVVLAQGQFSEHCAGFLPAYLDAFADRWTEHALEPGAGYRVYVRRGAAPPR
ncbi:MAG: glycosyltransferase family 39 protein [Planctomycetota bacterium]|nr:glycosyltransferase family 39 protein [Planctomycetota bacterium]MDA0933094.1 glycosyltransferase family 39 protein [Planctomycetota bacterium]